jgi:5-methylcytosine-specific restriction endonuclease McrA
MSRSNISKPKAIKSTAKNTTGSTHAKYGQKDTAIKVFNLAKPIVGKDPKLYRQDPYKNQMYLHSRGKCSKQGWDIDHIKPSSKGGSDSIRNLQALNPSINRSKGNTLVKASRHSGSK